MGYRLCLYPCILWSEKTVSLSRNINDREYNKFKSERGTRVRTQSLPLTGNSVSVERTSISTTAKRISTPVDASVVKIRHNSADTVWLGGDSSTDETNGFPLKQDEVLELNLKQGDLNEVYAMTESGTATVYVIGEVTI